MSELWTVFSVTFVNILQVFLVALAAGLLVRAKVVTQAHIQGLSAVTVVVLLPCLTFSNITQNFHAGTMPDWWLMPLAAVAMIGFGLLLGWLAFARELPEKRSMLSLASLQNAGYLVLPIGQALFGERFGEFGVYCFLFILGVNPILWSVGKWLATAQQKEGFSWRAFVTPPFAATLFALFCVFTGLRDYVPGPAAKAVDLLGTAAVPVATFVLGASLGSIQLKLRPYVLDAARALGIKLFILPLAVIVVLRLLGLTGESLVGALLVIQASSAPATATILQVRNYGGDEQKIGSILFVGYLLCAVTLPFWYAAWKTMG